MERTFEDLKNFMNRPTHDIEDWNKRREKAKSLFSQECINRLDASGFVKKVVRPHRHRRHAIQ
jgi:hypothetical protein